MNTDRIEKQIVLRAPIVRVWAAVSDSQAFGSWFGVAFDGPFAAGTRLAGKIVPHHRRPRSGEITETVRG